MAETGPDAPAPASDYRIEHLRKVLGDRYTFDKLIGRGGFASVYRVRNVRLERVEALKVLNDDHSGEKEFSQRFTHEARVAAALDHPSIVKIYDFGDVSGIFWYSMQLIEGSTLADRLDVTGPLDEATVARISLPVLDALDYSHRRGVIHRDIKPDNIILDEKGRPYLMDFGIAKSAGSALKTQTGFVLGTPAYVSPEQATGTGLDGRADLYSFGVTLYELLTGKLPFEAADGLQAVLKRLTTDPEPPSRKRPVTREMESIVMKALARQRESRFASAFEMKASLEGFLARGTGVEPAVLSDVSVSQETVVALERPPSRAEEVGAPPVEAAPPPRPVPPPGPPAVTLPASSPAGPREATSLARPVSARRPSPGLLVVLAVPAVAIVAGGIWLAPRLLPLRRGETGAPVPTPVSAEAPADAVPAPTAALPPPTAVPEPTVTRPEPTRATPVPPRRSERPAVPDVPIVVRRAVTAPVLEGEGDYPTPSGTPAGCLGTPLAASVQVAADGSVAAVRLLSGGKAECADAVTTAIRGKRFQPALDAEGKPVPGRVGLSVTFR